MVTPLLPIVKRVDHIMIRVVPAAYDQLFSFFTETLRLPVTWPVNNYVPSFKTGGVFAGNISMEIFQSGPQEMLASPAPSQAQLYGIALEPYQSLDSALLEIDRRGITHTPYLPAPADRPTGSKGSMWTLLYFNTILANTLSAKQLAGQEKGDLTPLFTTIYRNGMIFLCEYTPTFYDTTQGRLNKQIELQASAGGPLGLIGTRAIIVGARDSVAEHVHWQHLFDPITSTDNTWQLADGPAIRLVPHTQDGLLELIWQVASLDKASRFLKDQRIRYTKSDSEIAIASEALFGLTIRLVA